MIYCKINTLFPGGGGIFTNYKSQLATMPYGGLDALQAQIIAKDYMDIKQVFEHLKCSISTARKRLYESDVRHIELEGKYLYIKDDVLSMLFPKVKKPKKAKKAKKK